MIHDLAEKLVRGAREDLARAEAPVLKLQIAKGTDPREALWAIRDYLLTLLEPGSHDLALAVVHMDRVLAELSGWEMRVTYEKRP